MPISILLGLGMQGSGRTNCTWTEKHILLQNLPAGKKLDTFLPVIQRLLRARGPLLGANGYVIGVRASVIGARRQARTFWADDPEQHLEQNPGMTGFNCEPQPVALRLDAYGANDGQKGKIWLTGCPDAIFRTGTDAPGVGPIFNAAPGFENNLTNYKAELTNGDWGFYAQTNPPESDYVPVSSWSNEGAAPFRLIATFAADGAGGNFVPAKLDVVQVYDVKMQDRGFRRPVGKWRVANVAEAAGVVSVTLDNSDGFDATLIKAPGLISSVDYGYVPYTEISGAAQGRHKRGASFAQPPGKSSPRQNHLV